ASATEAPPKAANRATAPLISLRWCPGMLGISFQARRIDPRIRRAAAGALHLRFGCLYLCYLRPPAARRPRPPARRSASFRVTEIEREPRRCRSEVVARRRLSH